MKAEITRVIPSGCFVTYIARTENGVNGRLYTGETFRNYSRWKGLKKGYWVSGVRWKDENKGILDADSLIEVIHKD